MGFLSLHTHVSQSPHSSGGWGVQIKSPVSASGKSLLPHWQQSAHYMLIWQKGQRTRCGLFYRSTHPAHEIRLIIPQKPYFLRPSPGGLGYPHMNFLGTQIFRPEHSFHSLWIYPKIVSKIILSLMCRSPVMIIVLDNPTYSLHSHVNFLPSSTLQELLIFTYPLPFTVSIVNRKYCVTKS